MDTPMMTCGHAANGTSNGAPVCVICSCKTVQQNAPSLEGRTARCSGYGRRAKHDGSRGSNECQQCRTRYREQKDALCRCEQPSSTKLAFFSYRGPGTTHWRGESPHDEYYCGCSGWD